MKRALTETEKKAIEIAKDIYQYHLGLVWQDIENPFYDDLPFPEKNWRGLSYTCIALPLPGYYRFRMSHRAEIYG